MELVLALDEDDDEDDEDEDEDEDVLRGSPGRSDPGPPQIRRLASGQLHLGGQRIANQSLG
jgi:hypothetical protein